MIQRIAYWAAVGAVAFVAGGAIGAVVGTSGHNDVVVGNTDAAKYWFHQSTGDCAEGSAAVIIGALTGHAPTEAQITAYAQSQGWYTPTGGTQLADLPGLFWWGGVVPSTVQATTLAGLEYALSHGTMVQAVVNAETIWATEGYKVTPTQVADHALVVDEIDETAGWVVLTDTGIPTGAKERVSLSVFATAWATSGDAVVEVAP